MPAEQKVDVGVVHSLWLAGLLPRARHREAVLLARDARIWRLWGQTTLLVVAIAHLLAAVVFFFAFNWAELTPEAKLATVQAGLLAAALASRLPLPRPAREGLLVAASAFIGVLLAVFGQIFQTGADAWQLFAAWAVLMLPWALVAQAAAHWVLWLVVVQVGLGTFLMVEVAPWSDVPKLLPAVVGAPALLLLALRELFVGRLAWLRPRWTRVFAVAAGLGPVWSAAAVTAVETWNWHSTAAAALFLVAIGLVVVLIRRDLAALAMTTLFVCSYVSIAVVAHSGFGHDGPDLLLAAFEIVAIFGVGSALLRHLHNQEIAHV